MKMDKKERMKDMPPPAGGESKYDGPEYPYGLCISLENESLDKLGIDLADFNVGDHVMVKARCEVKGVSSEARADGEDRNRLELQIARMDFHDEPMDGDGNEMDHMDMGEED